MNRARLLGLAVITVFMFSILAAGVYGSFLGVRLVGGTVYPPGGNTTATTTTAAYTTTRTVTTVPATVVTTGVTTYTTVYTTTSGTATTVVTSTATSTYTSTFTSTSTYTSTYTSTTAAANTTTTTTSTRALALSQAKGYFTARDSMGRLSTREASVRMASGEAEVSGSTAGTGAKITKAWITFDFLLPEGVYPENLTVLTLIDAQGFYIPRSDGGATVIPDSNTTIYYPSPLLFHEEDGRYRLKLTYVRHYSGYTQHFSFTVKVPKVYASYYPPPSTMELFLALGSGGPVLAIHEAWIPALILAGVLIILPAKKQKSITKTLKKYW